MEFFKIWRGRRGTIGVNKLTLTDMVSAEFMVLIMFTVFSGLFVIILPTLLLLIYLFSMITDDSDEDTSRGRLYTNILGVVSAIYFLVDYHNGWLAHILFASVVYEQTYDSLAVYNTSIGLLNIPLFFFGHELYRASTTKIGRIGMLLMFCFFGMRLTNKISSSIVPNLITQYVDAEIIKSRLELKADDDYYFKN